MQHTNKAEMKRKIELLDSNPSVKKKVPLKVEICAQLKNLQEKYGALEKENNWNKAIINQLELKVKQFEENNSSKVDKLPELHSVSVQTEEIIVCHKCDFEAEDKYDLDAHTYTEHSSDNYLTCRYCEYCFDTKKELMIHRKKHHLDKVNMCRDFSKGMCPFEDKICWYNHSETVIGTSMDMAGVKCNLCDENFINKSELMCHRKQNHRNTVPECKNYDQGTC